MIHFLGILFVCFFLVGGLLCLQASLEVLNTYCWLCFQGSLLGVLPERSNLLAILSLAPEIFVTLLLLLWGAHSWWCSDLTPGSLLRNQYLQARGTEWDAANWTGIDGMQGKCPSSWMFYSSVAKVDFWDFHSCASPSNELFCSWVLSGNCNFYKVSLAQNGSN